MGHSLLTGRPAKEPRDLAAHGAEVRRNHDGVGHPVAAARRTAVIVGPGDLEIIAPPHSGLSANSQCDVDCGEVAEGHSGRRVQMLVIKAAIRALSAGSNLEAPTRLHNVLDAIPLQAGDVENARFIRRIAAKAHAEEVETEAGVRLKLSEPNVSSGIKRGVVLHHLGSRRRLVPGGWWRDNKEPRGEEEPVIRERNRHRRDAGIRGVRNTHGRDVIELPEVRGE